LGAIFTFFARWGQFLSVLGISLGLFLAAVAAYLGADTLVLPALLALAFPFWWLGALLAAVWLFYRRHRLLYLPLGLLLIALPRVNDLYNFYNHNNSKNLSYSLVSYNLHYFNYLHQQEKMPARKNLDTILTQLVNFNSPILCLQEFSGQNAQLSKVANQFMSARYPHQHQGGGSSLAIFSRFPILSTGKLDFPQSHNGVIWADIQLVTKTVRVYNMHLQSVGLGADAEHVFDNQKNQNMPKYKRIGSKLSRAFALRAAQSRLLLAELKKCPYPIILAGDMNDTPASYAYAQISSLLYDSFSKGEAGFGATYNGNLPFLRIDYVFFSSHFQQFNQKVLPLRFSDHYPVRVDFNFK